MSESIVDCRPFNSQVKRFYLNSHSRRGKRLATRRPDPSHTVFLEYIERGASKNSQKCTGSADAYASIMPQVYSSSGFLRHPGGAVSKKRDCHWCRRSIPVYAAGDRHPIIGYSNGRDRQRSMPCREGLFRHLECCMPEVFGS
jgi:hypothetical protein